MFDLFKDILKAMLGSLKWVTEMCGIVLKWLIETKTLPYTLAGAGTGMGFVRGNYGVEVLTHQPFSITIPGLGHDAMTEHIDGEFNELKMQIGEVRRLLEESKTDSEEQNQALLAEIEKFNGIVGRIDWRFRTTAEKMESWITCPQR